MLFRTFKNAPPRPPYVQGMTRTMVVLALLATLACGKAEGGDAYDRAVAAANQGELKKAAELFAEAATSEKDPARRAKAELRAANLEWLVLRNFDAAKVRLQRVAAGAHEAFEAKLELARIAFEQKDFAAARAQVREGLAKAAKKRERRRGAIALAKIGIEERRVGGTIESLRAVITEEGPRIETSRLLLQAALLAGDGATAMEAVDSYYHVSSFAPPPNAIAAAHASLRRVLPSWRGTDPERPAIVEALGGIRFFEEAALVSRGAPTEVVKYAAAIERIEKLTNEYYRQLANGNGDDDDLRDGVKRELRPFGSDAALAKRFGTYFTIGKTGNYIDLHYGHIVGDRTLAVEQYGRKASMRFVELDTMVSNGYGTWMTDGRGGDGGWATDKEIYQVRPQYANGPAAEWQYYVDEETRAQDDKEMAEETARDRQRAAQQPIGEFPGLAKRLQRQYLDGVVAALRAKGLGGEALRDAFLARVEKDTFHYSILLHEGRHAIDKLTKENFKATELEYRAKLSEIALADAPRAALQSVLDNTIGGTSPHGRANERLAQGIVAWMEKNRASIQALDPSLPLMPQLDKLTDEQIREAVRSLDPMARAL